MSEQSSGEAMSRDTSVVIFIHGMNTDRMQQLAEELAKCPLPQGISGKIVMVKAERNAVPYRQLAEGSNAKYKFFLDGTGRILNRGLLIQALWAFQKHPDIGMVGLLGSKLPAYGNFNEARKIYGAYVETLPDGRMAVQNYLNPCLGVEDVQNLDEHFLATQYDLPWPEDAADPFLTARQAVSLQLAGYRTCVLEHHGYYMAFEEKSSYDHSASIPEERRTQFYQDCGKDAFPLVSILIPAYNQPDFLRDALESALAQDYPNIEIVIGDDSTDTRVKDMMAKYLEKYPHIRYYYHGGPLGGMGAENCNFVTRNAHGEYINMLLHDDLFHPGKISHMMNCFLFDDDHELAIVSSRYGWVDENGKPSMERGTYWTSFHEQRIPSEKAARRILCFGQNFIGGLASAIFRLSDLPRDFATGERAITIFAGVRDRGLGDMATWLELLRKGDCLFLPEIFSSIRLHSGQNEKNAVIETYCVLDRFSYVALCWLNGIYLGNDALIREALDMALVDSHAMLEGATYETEEKELQKHKEQVERLQELVARKEYHRALSHAIDYLLDRESGVDKDAILRLCVRDNASGLWKRRADG